MRMTTDQETLVDHETEKERDPHLTGGGEVKNVVAVMTKEMIGDPRILEVEAQEAHLDPQAVDRTTMVTAVVETMVEEEIQKRTNVRTVVVKIILQVILNVHKDKDSASSVSRLTMIMKIVTIAKTHLLVNSVEAILTTHHKIAHDGNRINFEKKRMTSDVLAKKDR